MSCLPCSRIEPPHFWTVEVDGVAELQVIPGIYDLLRFVYCLETFLKNVSLYTAPVLNHLQTQGWLHCIQHVAGMSNVEV
jgi:hypothetical protein